MKNNAIEIPVYRYNMFDYDFAEDVLTCALDNSDFKPICKGAWVNTDGEYFDEKLYLDAVDGKAICGKFLLSYEVALDGEVRISKDFFITNSGECLVFYTTYEEAYGGKNDEKQYRMQRFIARNQILSAEEKWDCIFEVIYGLYHQD
ncbi:hypothetical protein [Bacillus sp. REN16]|uniref:hypothetical protein n=1 Tax=Bacillus sp. REN16 TaxID=2887296 RepID=UPI001E2D624A|nr:hypothetical protein [Bacillus sp. REN16]MCC3359416.1 hypothetical protein [Bacillus sp. REN16]